MEYLTGIIQLFYPLSVPTNRFSLRSIKLWNIISVITALLRSELCLKIILTPWTFHNFTCFASILPCLTNLCASFFLYHAYRKFRSTGSGLWLTVAVVMMMMMMMMISQTWNIKFIWSLSFYLECFINMFCMTATIMPVCPVLGN